MEIDTKGKKFIPLRDYMLGKVVQEEYIPETKQSLIISIHDAENVGKKINTNKVVLEVLGNGIVEKDKIQVGVEAVFNGGGIDINVSGEKYKLLKEQNIIGVLQ